MVPRPSPPGTEHTGRPWVWAVDEEHLPHYLLPRQCPRVCWRASDATGPLLASTARRVVAVEDGWVRRLSSTTVHVHALDPATFHLLDAQAGYWVSDEPVDVLSVQRVDDCVLALAAHDVELRVVPSLWPLVDVVTEHAAEFSAIRLRNAGPRRVPGRRPGGGSSDA